MKRTIYTTKNELTEVDDEDTALRSHLRAHLARSGRNGCLMWKGGFRSVVEWKGVRYGAMSLAYALAGNDVPAEPFFIAKCGWPGCFCGEHRVLVSESKWRRWYDNAAKQPGPHAPRGASALIRKDSPKHS